MRQRLLTLSNENQEEYSLRNIFRKFDLDKSGALSVHELRGMLSQLGITAKDEHVVAMLKCLDTNENGCLEFEEFN